MSQAIKCNIFLSDDDPYFVCQHKDIDKIEKQLNAIKLNFADLCM